MWNWMKSGWLLESQNSDFSPDSFNFFHFFIHCHQLSLLNWQRSDCHTGQRAPSWAQLWGFKLDSWFASLDYLLGQTRMQNLNDVVMFHLSSHEFLSSRCMSTNVHPWSFPFAFKHFLAFKVSRINLSITSESTKRRMHSYGILWNPPIFSNWIKS